MLGSSCLKLQVNVKPSQINQQIQPRYGGAQFTDTFEEAYSLMNLYVGSASIRFIFMTDGGAEYPAQPISKIKILQNQHPKKIKYYGIEFQSNVNVMKQIK